MYTLTEISDKEAYTHFITFITLFTHFAAQILIPLHSASYTKSIYLLLIMNIMSSHAMSRNITGFKLAIFVHINPIYSKKDKTNL